MKKPKTKLIQDWKNAWKYATTQITVIGTVLGVMWVNNPELHDMFPPEMVQKYSPIIGVLIILARIIDFTGTEDKNDKTNKKIIYNPNTEDRTN